MNGEVERAGWFYRVIEDHVRAYVTIAVEIAALKQAVRDLDMPDYLENPYVTAFRAIFDFTAQHQHELGIADPYRFHLRSKEREGARTGGLRSF